MNSKALAHTEVPRVAAATTVPATRSPTFARNQEAATVGPPAPAPASVNLHVFVANFLRSFQVLVTAVRLYQRNHPHIAESLESVERSLRAAFRHSRSLDLRVERAGLTLLGQPSQFEAQPLADPREELRSLAEELAGAGVITLTFLPRTNLTELQLLAQAVDATARSAGADRGKGGAANRNWSAWLAEHRIAGIRVNARVERRDDDSVLAIFLGALPAAEPGAARLPFPESTIEQLREALGFLTTAGPRLHQAQQRPPQEAARIVRAELAGADPKTLALVKHGLAIDAPRQGDTTGSYLRRLGDTLVVAFLQAGYRAGRVSAIEVRPLIEYLSQHGDDAPTEEALAEERVERFWFVLPARDKARVLASRDAWCIPVPVLRGYLEPLATAAVRKGAEAAGREARRALVDYARCVESEEGKARRTAAAGLVELADFLDRLWPHPRFADMSGRVVDALLRETSPGIAGLLAAATETLARLAFEHGQHAELERILDSLGRAPRDAEHESTATLSRRILAQERWLSLVDTALANRPLDPALPKLLRRDPERLLDHLGLLLSTPEGGHLLPAMARLVRAAGEPVLGALQEQLSEPRRQRVSTAIKLLSAVEPERLAGALPRVLPAWDWTLQDLAVAELARQPNPTLRTRIARVLLARLTEAHSFVVPSMLDYVARADDGSAVPFLIEIAAGRVDTLRDMFIRIKAIEALGHLHAETAAPVLGELLRSRTGLTYVEPAGLRSAAEEALTLIENRRGSTRLRASQETAETSSSRFTRPRRYVRVRLPSPLPAKIEGPHAAAARVRTIALGGALIETTRQLVVGETISVEVRAGLRRIRTTSVVRSANATGYGIEFVHMKQEDREKLRRRIGKLLG